MAQVKMESITDNQLERNSTLELIIERIKSFSMIEKVWVYGSFARGDDEPKSDIDIALETSLDFSYFDLAEVQYQLEQQTNRKIDVG
ncbi:MAG: nucleotidyltransferase domain-containing protein, partial [Chitinophagaceae bacterium]